MSENINVDKIPKRVLSNLMTSLSAGVVPRSGAPYIAIGRSEEINAFLDDLDNVADGGSGMRFLVGKYGSGKTFLAQLIRTYTIERDYVCSDADLSPERRLYGTQGGGVATYRELLRRLSCKSSPDGGALPSLLQKYLNRIRTAMQNDGKDPDDVPAVLTAVRQGLGNLDDFVGGFDFARVLTAYTEAVLNEDTDRQGYALKWLRGEYATKTEAKRDLNLVLSEIIHDANWYEFIKLWAVVFKKIGYLGYVVFIDECVNLYKIPNRLARENNYEKILSRFNDTLQGRCPGLEIVLCGTPQFLEDPRRGLFSYEALKTRLGDGRFDSEEFRTLIGPVIRLRRLSDAELIALLQRVTALHQQFYAWKSGLTFAEWQRFLKSSLRRVGSEMMITPREMIRDYISLLNVLKENKNVTFDTLIGKLKNESDDSASAPAERAVSAEDLIF